MLFRLVSARCRLSSRSPLLLSLLLLKAASPLWRPKERKEESDCHDNLPSNTHAATLHCASCFDTFGPFFPSLPLCPILFGFLGPSRSFLSDKGSIYIYFISVASKQLYIDVATEMFGCRSKEEPYVVGVTLQVMCTSLEEEFEKLQNAQIECNHG